MFPAQKPTELNLIPDIQDLHEIIMRLNDLEAEIADVKGDLVTMVYAAQFSTIENKTLQRISIDGTSDRKN